MTKIVFRILFILVLVVNLVILMLSAISGVNIYQKYGKHILIGIVIFCAMIVGFYISLALLGVGG